MDGDNFIGNFFIVFRRRDIAVVYDTYLAVLPIRRTVYIITSMLHIDKEHHKMLREAKRRVVGLLMEVFRKIKI